MRWNFFLQLMNSSDGPRFKGTVGALLMFIDHIEQNGLSEEALKGLSNVQANRMSAWMNISSGMKR
ncbi:MAG: hypothetical protein GY869_28620 [Planctomycetes bacterium]|nr:hypothetical protein [Planctomycetota bacterium]